VLKNRKNLSVGHILNYADMNSTKNSLEKSQEKKKSGIKFNNEF